MRWILGALPVLTFESPLSRRTTLIRERPHSWTAAGPYAQVSCRVLEGELFHARGTPVRVNVVKRKLEGQRTAVAQAGASASVSTPWFVQPGFSTHMHIHHCLRTCSSTHSSGRTDACVSTPMYHAALSCDPSLQGYLSDNETPLPRILPRLPGAPLPPWDPTLGPSKAIRCTHRRGSL